MSSSINVPFFGGSGGGNNPFGLSTGTGDILSSILGGVGAGILNQPNQVNTNFNQNTTGTQSGTASTNRTLTPYQEAIQGPLFKYISDLMTNPKKTIAPFQAAARDQVNSSYNGLADTLRQQFMSTGGGSSGKFGDALVQGNLKRLGALSNTDTAFQEAAAQLPLEGAGIAESLLGMPFGSTSTANSTSTSKTSGSSQQTQQQGGFLSSLLGTGLGIAAKFL